VLAWELAYLGKKAGVIPNSSLPIANKIDSSLGIEFPPIKKMESNFRFGRKVYP